MVDSTAVDDPEQALRVEKLRLECERLRYEASSPQRQLERWKSIAATSGVFTAIVALFGVAVTFTQWRVGVRTAEEARADERLASGVTSLTSERELARLNGIS